MRPFGSDRRHKKHSILFLSALIFLTIYPDSCESRATNPESNEEGSEDSIENYEEDDDEPQASEGSRGESSWSMKNVKADDSSKDFVQPNPKDILEMMIGKLDVSGATLMRSKTDLHMSEIGIEVSGTSVSALCEELARFVEEDAQIEEDSKLLGVMVPVEYTQPPPIYDPMCVTWVSKPCKGRLPHIFDPECIFWLPKPLLSTCLDGAPSAVAGFSGTGVRLNGYLANSLCLQHTNTYLDGTIDAIALKTNEDSLLRCHDFMQISELEWVASEPSPNCEQVNKWRFRSLKSEFGVYPFIGGRTKCFGTEGTVECSAQ